MTVVCFELILISNLQLKGDDPDGATVTLGVAGDVKIYRDKGSKNLGKHSK